MTPDNTQRQRRDLWIPWTFAAMFGVVLIANGLLAYFALDSFPGLTTKKPYRQGLGFNETLEAGKGQAALGWSPSVSFSAATGGATEVTLKVSKASGETLRGARPEIVFRRPTVEGHDFTAALQEGRDGKYTAKVRPPLPGIWNLHIRATAGSRTLRWIRRAQLP